MVNDTHTSLMFFLANLISVIPSTHLPVFLSPWSQGFMRRLVKSKVNTKPSVIDIPENGDFVPVGDSLSGVGAFAGVVYCWGVDFVGSAVGLFGDDVRSVLNQVGSLTQSLRKFLLDNLLTSLHLNATPDSVHVYL